jgi:hypothetical protein
MILYAAIIPDNELLGVFTTEQRCIDAIERLSNKCDYVKNWWIVPIPCELDEIASDR